MRLLLALGFPLLTQHIQPSTVGINFSSVGINKVLCVSSFCKDPKVVSRKSANLPWRISAPQMSSAHREEPESTRPGRKGREEELGCPAASDNILEAQL